MSELTFNDDNFQAEVLNSPVPVLVDFWAEWCGPCRVQGPIINELAQEFKPDEIKIGKLNVDEAPSAPSRYQVMSIPTLMIFKGGKPVSQLVGIQNKSALKTMINELIKQ